MELLTRDKSLGEDKRNRGKRKLIGA